MADPTVTSSAEVPYRPHVGDTRQYWRDIILGVNDGLVSIFLLVAGVVGGGLTSSQVLLAAIAGTIGGAISMAAGEYLATRSQEEVFDREINLEREHIQHYRNDEVEQLYEFFENMGVAPDKIEMVVKAFSETDETLLNAMKVLEFGIVETERRSPYVAMVVSGLLFLVGSLPSVLPFAFTGDPALGLTIAAVLTAIGLFAVGAAKTTITDTHPVKSGAENMIIAGVGGVVAFSVGRLIDAIIL